MENNTLKINITDIYTMLKHLLKAQGIETSCIEKKETLYYDESGNTKHLLVKDNGKLNSGEDSYFVLGGVQAEVLISMKELKSYMKKDEKSELKANKELKGSFTDILRKEHFTNILTLIAEKGWHIHFDIVSVIYYGCVDIIDSIEGTDIDPNEMKAVLYNILRKDINNTICHFRKYKYPDIESKNIDPFLAGIISMMDKQIEEDATHCMMNPVLYYLKTLFEKAKKQKSLTFIQDEKANVWVGEFAQFYKHEIFSFPYKTLVFDEEKQVQEFLLKEEYECNGVKLSNYSFEESSSNPMIQVSDYVVSILRKYVIFLDRKQNEVEADINIFDTVQMDNFKLFNKILKASVEYNPVFFHYTVSVHTKNKFDKYMNEYGQ